MAALGRSLVDRSGFSQLLLDQRVGGYSRAEPGQFSQSAPSRSANLEMEGVRVGVGVRVRVRVGGTWPWGYVKRALSETVFSVETPGASSLSGCNCGISPAASQQGRLGL